MREGFSFTYNHARPYHPHASLDLYVTELAESLQSYTGEYSVREHALMLPLDHNILSGVKKMAQNFRAEKLKYVFVVGIGGSSLGAKAIYDALKCKFTLSFDQKPTLYFLETISSESVVEISRIIAEDLRSADDFVVNIISKSGTTAESVANFEILHHLLVAKFPSTSSRVICTTDVGSHLWIEASKQGFHLLAIPALVGGRFSVFSSVGLFPLFLAGIDVDELLLGAREMLHASVSHDVHKNHARRDAEELFAALHSGYTILNIFHFNPELESLGKWERQLIAESLGKERDQSEKKVHAGITPIVSIGSTDLHSMAQLYFGGPKDKCTMMVRAHETLPFDIPLRGVFTPLVRGIGGKNPADIMEAIFSGVRAAYRDHELPVLDVRLPDISPYTLGAYMEWRMATILYLARLMHVNPFDQPNVEDYKTETRKILLRGK